MNFEHVCDRDLMECVSGVTSGKQLPADVLAAVRSCERCRSVVQDMMVAIENGDGDVKPLVREVAAAASARLGRRWRIRNILSFLAAVTGSVVILSMSLQIENVAHQVQFAIYAIAFFIIWFFASADRERGGRPSRLYARLRAGHLRRFYSDGRIVEGNCAGIGEYLGVSPWLVRVLFVAGFFLSPAWAPPFMYLLLMGVLEFHPEDRHLMMRYRLLRVWRSLCPRKNAQTQA